MQRTLPLALGVFLLTGCATVTRGSTEAWVVESEPLNALVTLSTGETCTTPCALQRKRKEPFSVTIEKEGYETVRTQIISQVAGAGAAGMAGNLILGGVIGAAVDAGTGATKELKPNPLQVKLVPLSEAERSVEAIDRPK